MNDSRIELKVGFFVAVGLALLAVLVLSFSRGLTLFHTSYDLRILLPNAAGLKPTADVMMAGVPIGKASAMELLPNGPSVTVAVTVSILSKYKIRTNAVFHVDSLGFLGDQYIEVTPSTNLEAGYWPPGAVVQGESPFNMQEAVRSVAGLMDQAKKTVTDLDGAIATVNSTMLSEQSMSNFGVALSNINSMTGIAVQVAQRADDLIHSDSPAVGTAVTNLRSFSERLNLMAGDLDRLVATNRPVVDETIRNLRDTSAAFKQVAVDLEAGKGLAGGLLKDQDLKAETTSLISNANAMTAAFSAFGSNLNQRGLWHMLWKPKNTEKNEKSERSQDPAR
jgi:phospholipid/cholesterol/gamma-HCH transport system substrate-binding protein